MLITVPRLSMPESVTPLLPVMIDCPCQVCGKGVMRPVKQPGALRDVASGEVSGVRHACSRCTTTATYQVSYPDIQYVDFLDFIRDSQQVLDGLKHRRQA